MKKNTKYQLSYEDLADNYNNLLSLVPCHIYWKNKAGQYLGCNLLQALSLGFKSSEEIIGKTDFNLPWREQAPMLKASDLQVMKSKQSYTFEEEVILANGKRSIFLSKKAPLLGKDGAVKGVIGISFDISEQKQLMEELKKEKERAELANNAKSEFLANMRHDIRTPLSGIVGFSEILKTESTEPRIKEYAENLIASSHALLNLMDEVLEAVRVSSGDIPILKRKFDLLETMEQVIALYQARAHEKKLKLTLKLNPNLPQFVIGDKIRLHRVALELIGNALNFTDIGHVIISVELAKRENHQLVIKMTVTDSGIGIPKDKQQEIYVQFKRLTPSYQGIYKGAGLGLYVVKQFIDELGAEIYVESELRKGTSFTCLIPFQEPLLNDASGIDTTEDLKSERHISVPLVQHIIEKKDSTATMNILVIEDNIIAQSVAKSLLSAMSCQVDIAANGPEALSLYKKNHYDLIFMDIGLGEGMDGYEITHHIRKEQDLDNYTPIIALTAHTGEESKQRCIEAGMDAVLTKPLTQAHASDILNTFVLLKRSKPSTDFIKTQYDLPEQEEELFQLDKFPLFDQEQALKNCGNNDMLIELLKLMITQELPNDLMSMKEAFKNKDYPTVEKIAHKIKGGAVYVCTTQMKFACQYMERYWKTGKRDLFDQLYQQTVTSIEKTCIYIKEWLKINL